MPIEKKSEGFGDSVAKFTNATGIDKVVKAVAKGLGKDCGCEQRRIDWNELWPYSKKNLEENDTENTGQ